MEQISKILRHGRENNFLLPHTNISQHEKQMDSGVCTIRANVPAFMPTKSSRPTFLFDKNDVYSDKKRQQRQQTRSAQQRWQWKWQSQWQWILWNGNLKIIKLFNVFIAFRMLLLLGFFNQHELGICMMTFIFIFHERRKKKMREWETTKFTLQVHWKMQLS